MTDRDAMLRAIAANPDEDTPRLAYADLLDEIGGKANTARARFIRLQIDAHRGPGDTGGTWAFDRKIAEAESLAGQFSREWLRELPCWCVPLFGPLGRSPADLFSRGFVERVRVKAKPLALRAAELFNTAPLRSLEIRGGIPELLGKVFDLTFFTRLKSLAIRWRNVGDDLGAAIARSHQLFNVHEVDLSGCWITERGARILGCSERLPELRTIHLHDDSVSFEVVKALAGSTKLVKLREIDLCGCRVWPETLTAWREQFPGKIFRR